MKISLNWLKEFVKLPKDISPEELGLALTLKTTEVESIEKQGKYLENVVIGKIKKIENHPNADKLKVCFVDIGEKEVIQIVCGGNNLREGMLTAVAKIGALVKWHGSEEVRMERIKIRGVESNGMMCTSAELELNEIISQEDEREIIDLEKIKDLKLEIGKPLSDVLNLNDVIFEIDNKSITHRPDLWSHYGIAREVSAIYNLKFPLSKKNSHEIRTDSKREQIKIDVEVKDTDLCSRYMALVMSGVEIKPSPQWMQKRLLSVGMRPINNIVDITNYVMLELGQPMHAFDISKLKSQNSKIKLIIRRANKDTIGHISTTEKIKTLDGVERELDSDMLVIADEEKPIAIAGVMGGENSEIDEKTETIILESANFERVNNRKTSAKLGLRTEAVMRYEKGLDPLLTEKALNKCVELIKEIIPSAKIDGLNFVPTQFVPLSTRTIKVPLDYINKKIGIVIAEKKIIEILELLGFNCASQNGVVEVKIPSWRATGDIEIPDDIVEEVARIYGYDNVIPQMPSVILEIPEENKERNFERKIKGILSAGERMIETNNYSFVNRKQLENLGFDPGECMELINPMSQEQTLLRPSLIINLLENVKNNLRYFETFKIFEMGSAFRNETGNIESGIQDKQTKIKGFLPWQEKFITGMIVEDKNKTPFYKAKEIAEELLNELNIDYELMESRGEMWQHPYRKAKIKGRDPEVELGYITELNPIVGEKIGIKNARIGIFELSLNCLQKSINAERRYEELPKFPEVGRDLAIVVPVKTLERDIINLIEKADHLIRSVELFDVFEHEKLGRNKKSMAFHIIFQSNERTLMDNEIEKIMERIITDLESKLGAEIRS